MATPRIPAEKEQRICELWRGTLSNRKEIATLVGVSSTTVGRVIRRGGFAPHEVRPKRRRTTLAQNAEIVRRYAAGESADSLAAEFGFKCHQSVHQRVRAAGQRVRPGGGREVPLSPQQQEAILRLRNEEGLCQEATAARLGVSQSRVSKWLVANGHRTWPLSRHPGYSGGPVRLSNGYLGERLTSDDPYFSMAFSSGYVPQHRLVMARALGRPLKRSETVHHINGDKTDNRLVNLQLRRGRHGKGWASQCGDCGSTSIISVPIGAEGPFLPLA